MIEQTIIYIHHQYDNTGSYQFDTQAAISMIHKAHLQQRSLSFSEALLGFLGSEWQGRYLSWWVSA
jgi:hypothetical protein